MATNNQVNVGLSGSSGTGSFAGTTSPSFTTPVLGTPSSGDLSNCVNVPVAQATGILPLANGGAGASLTAHNGGFVYCTASNLVVHAAGTAGQLVYSQGTSAPSWTTSTYPASNAVNTLLYASSANAMAALATANSSVLVTSSGGVPSWSTTLPSGLSATNLSLTTPTLGAATATSITFSPTTGGIVGTTTNDSAGAGFVGQVISNQVINSSAVSLTNNTPKNVTTLSLTAGDWDIFGGAYFTFGGTATQCMIAISSSNAGFPDQSLIAQLQGTLSITSQGLSAIPYTVSLSGSATYYLVAEALFSTSTATVCGIITARRAR